LGFTPSKGVLTAPFPSRSQAKVSINGLWVGRIRWVWRGEKENSLRERKKEIVVKKRRLDVLKKPFR